MFQGWEDAFALGASCWNICRSPRGRSVFGFTIWNQSYTGNEQANRVGQKEGDRIRFIANVFS